MTSTKNHPIPCADDPIEAHLETEYAGLDDKETIEYLKREVVRLRDASSHYYATALTCNKSFTEGYGHIPTHGSDAVQCKEKLVQIHELDNRPRLNTSSYVNVVFEQEEKDIAIQGMSINLADGSVYPASIELHDNVVDSIAQLWNCPREEQDKDENGNTFSHFAGAGTVGSTEACLLALLAHKFRWRKWYAARHGLSQTEVIGVIPNIVIGTHYQACWEKAFRYFDVQPKFLYPEFNKFRIDPEDIKGLVDEKTIMVVGIMGNHYNGTYDPIWEMDKIVEDINNETGFQVGIHVDAASGGFIAPFQDNVPAWDFRLKNVLTISASGHKFGESSCGTGWVIFRHRHDLSEHIEVEVTYLGGVSYSMTLNFSRPATGVYVQAYKFLRMGMQGYRLKVSNQLEAARFFREKIRAIKWSNGEPLFEICDPDQDPGLPVFAARVNPELELTFDDFNLQHAIAEFHWYVSAYHLSFEDFSKGGITGPLCKDEPACASMFRVVFKSNLTLGMAEDLFFHLQEIVEHFKSDRYRRLSNIVCHMEDGVGKVEVAEEDVVPPSPSGQALDSLSGKGKGGHRRLSFQGVTSIRQAMALQAKQVSTAKVDSFSNQHAPC